MDRIDRRRLAALREDPSQSMAEPGERVGPSLWGRTGTWFSPGCARCTVGRNRRTDRYRRISGRRRGGPIRAGNWTCRWVRRAAACAERHGGGSGPACAAKPKRTSRAARTSPPGRMSGEGRRAGSGPGAPALPRERRASRRKRRRAGPRLPPRCRDRRRRDRGSGPASAAPSPAGHGGDSCRRSWFRPVSPHPGRSVRGSAPSRRAGPRGRSRRAPRSPPIRMP